MPGPIEEMLTQVILEDKARFYMPGHKGELSGVLGTVAPFDITEIEGADSLFEAQGVIRDCERRLSALYGAGESLISCGGSTLCIQAMLTLATKPGEKVLFARNIHRAALSAMVLLGITPRWVLPRGGYLDPLDVKAILEQEPDIRAFYLTSPDYCGMMQDIPSLSALCRERGVTLLVDNAHGAHLRFLPNDCHPITLGADACCDSLHKTMPAITGTAALHLRGGFCSREQAKEAMGLFGSTSPSYLMLLSIDQLASNSDEVAAGIRRTVALCNGVRNLLGHLGLPLLGDDPMKLCFSPLGRGYTGTEYAAMLRKEGIECEYAGQEYLVLMPSAHSSDRDFMRLKDALVHIPARPAKVGAGWDMGIPVQAMPPRQAYFGKTEHIDVAKTEGRIYADIRWPCPPAVPILLPGEKIDKNLREILVASGKIAVKVVQ